MATYFCPNCRHELSEEAYECPVCGYDLSNAAHASYEDKLLSALGHPVRENRMMAIQLLGRLRSQKALPEFERMLAAEEDYYLLKELLYALAAIDTRPSKHLIAEATNHRSRLVRQVAKELSQQQRRCTCTAHGGRSSTARVTNGSFAPVLCAPRQCVAIML